MKGTLRILILEDNPDDAELMECELKEAGMMFTSDRVMTKEEFVQGIERCSPDIILSDYDLPQYNGASALEEARKRCPDIPFILVTGAVSEDRAIEILTSGANDYVLKNRLHRLAPAVQRALAEAQERRARKEAEAELRKAHRALEDQVRVRTAELQDETAGHRRTLEELRESEEKFRSAFDDSAVPMAISALDGGLIRINAAFSKMLAYSEAKLATKNERELTHPDDLAATESGRAQVIRGEKRTHRMEQRLLRKDGRIVWADVSTSSVRDALGKPLYLIIHLQDITKRKRAEELLRDNEEQCRLIVQSSPSGILMNLADGAIRRVNPAAKQILGRTEKEIVDSGIEGLIDTTDPRFGPAVDERTRTGKFSGELNFKRKDGTIFPVEISSVLFRDRKGRVFTSTMFRDITWRKQFEGMMKKKEKSSRELADSMPHLIWTATPEGLFDYFNQQREEFPDLVKGSSGFWEWNSTIHPEDLQRTLEFMRKDPEPGEIMQVEHRMRHKNGTYRWYLSRRVGVRGEKGKIVKWIGTTTDIHYLKEEEQRLEALLGSSEPVNC